MFWILKNTSLALRNTLERTPEAISYQNLFCLLSNKFIQSFQVDVLRCPQSDSKQQARYLEVFIFIDINMCI